MNLKMRDQATVLLPLRLSAPWRSLPHVGAKGIWRMMRGTGVVRERHSYTRIELISGWTLVHSQRNVSSGSEFEPRRAGPIIAMIAATASSARAEP